MQKLSDRLRELQTITDEALLSYLPQPETEPERLHQAMHYVVFNGGKRIRPALLYATGEALGAKFEMLHKAATAVELIHAYSLTHDDLPAMDDDDLRRGKPTCHKAFDEATAILAGDALLTLAFDILSQHDELIAQNQLAMIQTLAKASGAAGMVGGQAIDLYAVGHDLNIDQLKNMHSKKTGALINASVLLAAYASNASEHQRCLLSNYADCIGLSFQIWDDVLDVIGDTEVIGKSQGSDQALNKPTYVTLLGLDGAKQAAKTLHLQALAALEEFDSPADTLRQISAYIIKRDK